MVRSGVHVYSSIVGIHVRCKTVSGKVQGYIEEVDGVQVYFDFNFKAIFFKDLAEAFNVPSLFWGSRQTHPVRQYEQSIYTHNPHAPPQLSIVTSSNFSGC